MSTMRLQFTKASGKPMGLTYATVRIQGLARDRDAYEATFLVDTGAFDCLAPASALHAAGVRPEGVGRYELANGEILELAYGFSILSFMDSLATGRVIFGPEGVEPILGVLALESAGVVVDPVTQTLKRLATRHLKRAA